MQANSVNKQKLRFAIIIPMYNESDNAKHCLKRVNDVIVERSFNADIIVVDDGSIDGTSQQVKSLIAEYSNIKLCIHKVNKGFGAARKTGMEAVLEAGGYEFVIFIDADLTMDPRHIEDFYNKIMEGYDFVIGSRFIKGGGMQQVPFFRAIFSYIGGAVFRCSFRLGIKDYTQGFRAIRTDIIDKLKLKETGFPILVEEIYQAAKHTRRFDEVPFILTVREKGISKFQYSQEVLRKYLKYALKGFFDSFRQYPSLRRKSQITDRMGGIQ